MEVGMGVFVAAAGIWVGMVAAVEMPSPTAWQAAFEIINNMANTKYRIFIVF
jgi:hypothetical protein